MRSRFLRFVRTKRLISPGDRVLVAVSGGIDSMVMLHLLKDCAADLQIQITAAHFDHAMRANSAGDAEWLAHVCEGWRIPFVSERSTSPLNNETAARNARYEFLHRAQHRSGAQKIATAHHADDQVETVLFRLMRGAGLRGLSGIPVRRGVIIRPLFPFKKTELENYANQHKIPFRFDETNATDLYARNRIRKRLIPVMQAVRPNTTDSILALARRAAATERWWRSLMREVRKNVVLQRENGEIQLARDRLLEYDAEIRARLLRGVLRWLNSSPDRDATNALSQFVERAESGRSFHVAGGVRAERAYDVIRIARVTANKADGPAEISSCSDGHADALIGGCRWQVKWTASHTRSRGEAETAAFDCSAITFPLIVRAWQPGDRMRMPYGTKKLKKLFAEHRVPFNVRARLPVVADADGRILWIPKVARSTDAAVVDDNPALTITVTNAENS